MRWEQFLLQRKMQAPRPERISVDRWRAMHKQAIKQERCS